jgi:hypothetical protein
MGFLMYPHCDYNLLWFIQPFPLLSLSLTFPSFSRAFNTYCYVLKFHRYYVLWYCWCSIFLFSFPSFPKFHTVVPLLQTCSTSEFVNDHVCFVCMFIFWIYLPHMREDMWTLSIWTWLTSLNMMSSSPPIASIYLQITWCQSSL